MAAIYMDGFDTYGTGLTGNANLLKSQWTTISSDGSAGVLRTPAWGARTGTYAMTCVVAPSQSNVLQLRTSLSTVLMSLGFAITALPTSSLQSNICSFGSSTGGVVAQLWCQPDGTIALTDSTNTVIASSASGVISQAATWYFLEMSYSQSAGTFTLRVNDNLGTGTPLIQAVSLSLGSTAVNQIGFVGSARTYYDWVDDIFIRSSTGTYNAGWLGARSIGTLATVATYTAGSNIVLGTPLATTTLTSAIQVGYVSPSGSYTGIGSTFTTTNSNTAIVTNTVPSAVNNYFNDIYDADPNTSSVLSPFAIANGTVSINPTGGADTNITQVTVLIAYGTGIISSSALPAWTFVLDGHRFYVLSLGAQGDWAYDFTTKEWCHLQSQGFPGMSFTHGVMWGSDIIGGDIFYPYLYSLDPTQPLDEGWREVQHVVSGGIPTRGRSAIGVANFTLTASVGLDSAIKQPLSLAFSDDNGVTWSPEFGECLTDVSTQSLIWNSLGSFAAPGRVFRITDYSGPIRIDGVDVVLTIGNGADSGQDQEGQRRQ